MKELAPAYYASFHCKAGKCRHNCCIGWEVDIDSETLEKYRLLDGNIGKKVRENICWEDGTFFFRMNENGRCPFLCDDNLCELIKSGGDALLCEICGEHPRFYNFFSSAVEAGIGLACEEAARIITENKEPFSLVVISDDGENEKNDDLEDYVISMRDECIRLVENENKPLSEGLSGMLSLYCAEKPVLSGDELYRVFSSLERLDGEWDKSLEKLKSAGDVTILDFAGYSRFFRNLTVYFIYRHLSAAVYDGRIRERAIFAYLSVTVIASICQRILEEKGRLASLDIAETARAYSAETEYSDENIEKLLSILTRTE